MVKFAEEHADAVLASLRQIGESSEKVHGAVLGLVMRMARYEQERKDLHDLVSDLHKKRAEDAERLEMLERAFMFSDLAGSA